MKKKTLVFIIALTIVVGFTLGGTLAWLTDKTEDVVNTFTVGNIDIDLEETTGANYKMIPGVTLEKNPTVTVEAGSEACWLFVKVTEEGGMVNVAEQGEIPRMTTFSDYITYGVNSEWTRLESASTPGTYVYYREVKDLSAGGATEKSFPIIGYTDSNGDWVDNKVLISEKVTKSMMDALENTPEQLPKLTFKAYAIQKEGFADAEAAWKECGN